MSRRKTPRAGAGPLLLMLAGGLLLAVTLVLALSPQRGAPAAPAPDHAENTFPQVARVSLDEARTALDAGTALFVHVRDATSFAAGHIPGAVSLPLGTLEQHLGELDPQAWIITYCT